MKFFVRDSSPPTRDFRELHASIDEGLRAGKEYGRHLQSIFSRLPEETRLFAVQPWYRDPRSHDCPHDAWLQKIELYADTKDNRSMRMNLILLGAYHDKTLMFEYLNVSQVSMNASSSGGYNVGEWMADEFDVLSNGFVSHEIQWEKGTPWIIVSERVSLVIRNI